MLLRNHHSVPAARKNLWLALALSAIGHAAILTIARVKSPPPPEVVELTQIDFIAPEVPEPAEPIDWLEDTTGKETELPKTELPKTEPPKTELPKTELPKTEPPKTELPKTEPPKTELPKTELPKTQTESESESETESEVPKTPQPPLWLATHWADHTPPGDQVLVAIDFRKLRDTPLAQPVTAVLEPMPDYALLVPRGLSIVANIDIVAISSSDPRSVTATNLAALADRNKSPKELLAKTRYPITWTETEYGARGHMQRSRNPFNDRREFFVPQLANDDGPSDGWFVLASSGDSAVAVSLTTPPLWIGQLPRLAKTFEDPSSPLALVSASDLPSTILIPGVGALPGPQRITAALFITEGGVIVRGQADFHDEAGAKNFAHRAQQAARKASDSFALKLVLSGFNALNAVTGLNFARAGSRVSFSTSISNAEGRSALERAADWSRRYFLRAP